MMQPLLLRPATLDGVIGKQLALASKSAMQQKRQHALTVSCAQSLCLILNGSSP